MKKSHKKILSMIIYVVLSILIMHYGRITTDGYRDLKCRMYYDFECFGIELEHFNNELSKILVLKDFNDNKEKVYINENSAINFYRSNYRASDMGEGKGVYDYDFMYRNINDVIHQIFSDGMITPSEEKYLQSLYNYTDALIHEYRKIVGDAPEGYDYKKTRKLESDIVDIYNNYSKKAEDLLYSKKYSFLKEYEGDFKDYDFQKAKKYCEKVFLIVAPDQILKYDNKDEINNKEYIFKAYKDRSTAKDKESNVDYEVSYNKITNKIVVNAVSYNIPSKKNKEDKIDRMANEVIRKLNPNLINYERKVRYDKKKLDRITYGYIEKINGVYDETKKVKMVIEGHGLISKFEIFYPNDENIKMPTIKKEEVLSKINPKAKIKDCHIRRNIEGRVEYVVHLEYKGTLYEVIFDGEEGTLKSYDRNIQVKYTNSKDLIKAESNEINKIQIDYKDKQSKQIIDSTSIGEIVNVLKDIELRKMSKEEEIPFIQNTEKLYSISFLKEKEIVGMVMIFSNGDIMFGDTLTMSNKDRTQSYIHKELEKEKLETIYSILENI
ncbi:hypothetical protein [Inediibacterium massiliense]|uniref:hypothetical protein n=1 Tax=Inediibacterium massiliense TaxID=1658111 RepID=UPI0006B671BA|nr:hypothetical protein [Inediibacterium massiliense]